MHVFVQQTVLQEVFGDTIYCVLSADVAADRPPQVNCELHMLWAKCQYRPVVWQVYRPVIGMYTYKSNVVKILTCNIAFVAEVSHCEVFILWLLKLHCG